MKVLFLGNIINSEEATNYLGPSVAGNRMQLGLVKGLKKIFSDDLTIISQTPIAAFPREKVIVVRGAYDKLLNNLYIKRIPFINIFLIKQLSKIINTFFVILKWCIINRHEKKIIISYNAFSEFAIPILGVKHLYKVYAIPLLADLPINNMFKDGRVKKKFRKAENWLTKRNIKKFDGLAVLNKHAVEEFSPTSKYVVIDGGYDLDDEQVVDEVCAYNENDKFICVYSGILVEYNGLKKLIEAAKLVKNPKFRLHIYGKGSLEDYINAQSQVDSRIEYKGLVSGTEILKIQKSAFLLISPLLPEHPVARVAFPSKIVEYMASGTPVISTKVNALNEDYLENIFVFEDTSPESMARTIDRVLSYDINELKEKGLAAKDFIRKQKNWDMQCERLVEFFYEISR